MDRNIIADTSILDASVRDQIPVITDPEQAEALLRALVEALSSGGNVQAEFRAGSLWDRKGYDAAGDFSPLVAPSPHRDPNGDDEVYLSVSVRIGNPDAAAVNAFVKRQRQQSERHQLTELEEKAARQRNTIGVATSTLNDLETRAAELRAAIGQ